MIWSSLVDFNVNNFFLLLKYLKKEHHVTYRVILQNISEIIFFSTNIQGTFTKKMEVLEAVEEHLASYILKKNASKEKENMKPKAFRHTGKWMRFHRKF